MAAAVSWKRVPEAVEEAFPIEIVDEDVHWFDPRVIKITVNTSKISFGADKECDLNHCVDRAITGKDSAVSFTNSVKVLKSFL